MDFVEEGGRALVGGLMVPREKPLIQPAVRWLLMWRPLEPKLIDSLCHNTDELLIRSGSGVACKRTVARGRGQSQGPITLPHPKPSEKGCHPSRALSRRGLARLRPLESSAPLFLPHRSLGGKELEGARDGVAF